jgi:hypothetical protein
MTSVARETLQKARLFLAQANQVMATDSTAFLANLEAAIVFGRSITFHLQNEYRSCTGFEEWYTLEQHKMRHDPLLRFLVEARNLILKQVSLGVRRYVFLSGAVTVRVISSARLRVKRAERWPKRGVKILWEDVSRDVRYWVCTHIFQPVLERFRRFASDLKARRITSVATSSDQFYFDEPAWDHTPAVELVEEYLDKLEKVVTDVEATFGMRLS